MPIISYASKVNLMPAINALFGLISLQTHMSLRLAKEDKEDKNVIPTFVGMTN